MKEIPLKMLQVIIHEKQSSRVLVILDTNVCFFRLLKNTARVGLALRVHFFPSRAATVNQHTETHTNIPRLKDELSTSVNGGPAQS